MPFMFLCHAYQQQGAAQRLQGQLEHIYRIFLA